MNIEDGDYAGVPFVAVDVAKKDCIVIVPPWPKIDHPVEWEKWRDNVVRVENVA
jgi:hypothetical protein